MREGIRKAHVRTIATGRNIDVGQYLMARETLILSAG
jgi:hypothetical protein